MRIPARNRLPVALMLCIASVAVVMSHPATASAEQAPALTAIEISDGVLFNDGPAAKHLTALNRYPTTWNEDGRRIQQRIHRAIESEPRFAGSFARRMQSGDPLEVSRALDGLSQLARRSLDEEFGRAAVRDMLEGLDDGFENEKLILEVVRDVHFARDLTDRVFQNTSLIVRYTNLDNQRSNSLFPGLILLVPTVYDDPRQAASARLMQAIESMMREIAVGLQAGTER